nr:hypothetical protein [Thiothrix nivea]
MAKYEFIYDFLKKKPNAKNNNDRAKPCLITLVYNKIKVDVNKNNDMPRRYSWLSLKISLNDIKVKRKSRKD